MFYTIVRNESPYETNVLRNECPYADYQCQDQHAGFGIDSLHVFVCFFSLEHHLCRLFVLFGLYVAFNNQSYSDTVLMW